MGEFYTKHCAKLRDSLECLATGPRCSRGNTRLINAYYVPPLGFLEDLLYYIDLYSMNWKSTRSNLKALGRNNLGNACPGVQSCVICAIFYHGRGHDGLLVAVSSAHPCRRLAGPLAPETLLLHHHLPVEFATRAVSQIWSNTVYGHLWSNILRSWNLSESNGLTKIE